jgi:DNA topoisomerase I
VENGRTLSERQRAALDSIVVKYSDQIPGFEALKASLKLDKPERRPIRARARALLDLMKTVKAWNPPVKRGKREFNDKEFFESLSSQFAGKGALSEKQVAALKKMLARYADQIPATTMRASATDCRRPKRRSRIERRDP